MRSHLRAAAILLAEVLAFYHRVLFFPSQFVIPYDLPAYHLSLADFMARSLGQGQLPLWDPFTYCGFPAYANLTMQLFYPPMLLTALISNLAGGKHLLYFLEVHLIGHVLLGGVLAYWLLRRLRVDEVPALTGASVFQLGGYFASQTQHLGAVDAAAWLPLSWLAVVALGERFQWRWLAALVMSFAMSLLAGFPQVTAVAFGSCLLLGLLISYRLLPAIALGTVWAGLAAAVQLLPTFELTRLSVAAVRTDWMDALPPGLPPQSLITLVSPNHFGVFQFRGDTWKLPWNPTFLYLYCGIGGLVLALAAAVARRHKFCLIFVALTVAAGLVMIGVVPPLPAIVRASVYPEFAMAAFVLGLATLAGLGAALLPKNRALQGIVLAAVAADLILAGSGRPINTGSLARDPGVSYEQMDGYREIPERVRALVHTAWPPYRIDTVRGSMLWSQCAPLLQIPNANGVDPFALHRFIQVRLSFCKGERWGRFYEPTRPDSAVLDLLNVRFLLSREALSLPPKFARVGEVPGHQIYENRAALPRFFLAPRVQHAADMQAALSAMRSSDFDPANMAVVEARVDIAPHTRPLPAVQVRSYAPREVVLETTAEAPVYLVTSETWYPGWRAWVDGKSEPLLLTNAAFRGLPLEAGRHMVTMRFEPQVLRYGAWISIAALGALAAALRVRR